MLKSKKIFLHILLFFIITNFNIHTAEEPPEEEYFGPRSLQKNQTLSNVDGFEDLYIGDILHEFLLCKQGRKLFVSQRGLKTKAHERILNNENPRILLIVLHGTDPRAIFPSWTGAEPGPSYQNFSDLNNDPAMGVIKFAKDLIIEHTQPVEIFIPQWSGELGAGARSREAEIILGRTNEENNNSIEIRNQKYSRIYLLSYSHGGNIALDIVDILRENQSPVRIDVLANIFVPNIPLRRKPRARENVGLFLNIYSEGDMVQTAGTKYEAGTWKEARKATGIYGEQKSKIESFSWNTINVSIRYECSADNCYPVVRDIGRNILNFRNLSNAPSHTNRTPIIWNLHELINLSRQEQRTNEATFLDAILSPNLNTRSSGLSFLSRRKDYIDDPFVHEKSTAVQAGRGIVEGKPWTSPLREPREVLATIIPIKNAAQFRI